MSFDKHMASRVKTAIIDIDGNAGSGEWSLPAFATEAEAPNANNYIVYAKMQGPDVDISEGATDALATSVVAGGVNVFYEGCHLTVIRANTDSGTIRFTDPRSGRTFDHLDQADDSLTLVLKDFSGTLKWTYAG